MDSETNLEALKGKVRDFCEVRDWDKFHNAKELVIGIVTEAAELLQELRFKSHAETDELMRIPVMRARIEDELADVLFFILRLSQRYGIDLSEALQEKLKKNEEKYPAESSRGSNTKVRGI